MGQAAQESQVGGLPGLERNLGPSHSRFSTQAHVQDLSRPPDHDHPPEGEHLLVDTRPEWQPGGAARMGVDSLWPCDWGYLLVVAGSPSMFRRKAEMGGGQGAAPRPPPHLNWNSGGC